jgi:MFS transporter, NNP family, nitrate/nitrite transporter
MKINIEKWEVENTSFWEERGRKIAWRNLWISIPALLLSFAIWMMWSIITTMMKDLGFNFGMISPDMSEEMVRERLAQINNLYYTLPAIAGLAGATLRIPNSFLIALAGGRNVIFTTTVLLLIPALGVGFALQDQSTSYGTFAALALLSGIGGGNFASSMSNISYFFPKKVQGTSLGLNAGIGNLGVGVMQKLIPWVTGIFIFSAVTSTGEIMIGLPLAGLQNAAWVWVPLLVISALAAFLGMNNVITGTPTLTNALQGIGKTLFMVGIGVVSAAAGSWLLVGAELSMWIVLPVVIILTMLLLKFLSPKSIKVSLGKQFSILGSKHNWIMTIIYTMTFGSFIGFSAAFPKLCQDIFVYTDLSNPQYVNPNAPDFLAWVFIGPMLGALVRPVGGWLSDKINSGSRVTTFSTITQIITAAAVAYFIIQAKNSSNPETYWWPFFACFMILFVTTGIGNGSTFRSIPYIFSKEQTGPVLGWISAIAAYGAFIIPTIFGEQIQLGTPEYALYGFCIYYIICLMLNWWYYDRPNSGIDC